MPRMARSHRLRRGRVSETGRIYLITTACYHRQELFRNLYRGRQVVQALKAVDNQADTLCYVIMPDHLHWLMQLRPGSGLSDTVQKTKSLTTKALKRVEPEIGRVWQRGFHDRALRQEDIVDVARYVVANPLRAGIVRSVRDYPLWDAIWI